MSFLFCGMKGYIVYSTYDIRDGKTIVCLYGRLENGNSFVAVFPFQPYFYIREKDEKKVSVYLKKYKVEKSDFFNFEGNRVVKVSSESHIELNKLHEHMKKMVETYEADIKPHNKFIIENDIFGGIELDGDYEPSERVDRVYNGSKISALKEEYVPKLKIVSLDIEADDKIICIGLYSEGYKRNFMRTKQNIKNVISCNSEEEIIIKFREEMIKIDPDIITGWNVIDFDLVYLKNKFAEYKLPFDFARSNENIKLRIESEFFRSSSADIVGRQVLDAMNLIKDPFIKEAPMIKKAEFDSYSLEDVSQALLKRGKLIKGSGKLRHEELYSLFEKNNLESHQKIVDYNLLDCELAYDILDKVKIIDLALERSQLTGMSLDRLTSSIGAFDSLYIREAHKRKLVSPTTHYSKKEEKIKGGYVQQAVSGIYHNVLVLDFKSLYPSIIRTFNIDPSSFLKKRENNAIESPNGAYFKNGEGILPEIIKRLHQAREKAKKEKRELSSYAIKVIMNSFFGVLASPNCRYFNMDVANSITHFGQYIIKLTAEEIKKKGYDVIYSDTDSIFLHVKNEKDNPGKIGLEMESHINEFYKKMIKAKYKRESFLELQFDKHFLSLMIPSLRGEDRGAKKRYAGLVEKDGKESVEIVGLEAIRGDWTESAREFQRELLDKVFHKEEVAEFIRKYVKKLQEGKLDSKLVYRKSIRKNLAEYTKTTPPHVKAARKMDKLEGNVIEYYITLDGPEPIQKIKHKIDYEHYIEKQIKPIANQILSLFGKNFDDLIKSSKQTKLF